jgi:hypothetical protein
MLYRVSYQTKTKDSTAWSDTYFVDIEAKDPIAKFSTIFKHCFADEFEYRIKDIECLWDVDEAIKQYNEAGEHWQEEAEVELLKGYVNFQAYNSGCPIAQKIEGALA